MAPSLEVIYGIQWVISTDTCVGHCKLVGVWSNQGFWNEHGLDQDS